MKILLIALALLGLSTEVQARNITAVVSSVNGHSILNHGDYFWNDVGPGYGPVQVSVNLTTQMAYVKRGDALIGVTSISSGREGFETQEGVFPVLGKEDNHHSKKYDADMPWTMWLTNDGVALHSGSTPGRPSSHGCVHLPLSFAQLLYPVVKKGTVVVITRDYDTGLNLTFSAN